MIPLRDNIPSARKPYMAWTIVALNTLVFLYEILLDPTALNSFYLLAGVVPRRLTDPLWAAWMGFPANYYVSTISYMFVHGGWLHFLGNMWIFLIFSDNVEDGMGHFRFLVFYLICGLGSMAAHVLFNPDATIPIVGASGAIAGVMGAYMLYYPHARVLTLIPIIIIPWIIELPAVIFLGLWFVIQLFSGAADWFSPRGAASVAWWAHVGGFALGMLLAPRFRNPSLCEFCFHEQA